MKRKEESIFVALLKDPGKIPMVLLAGLGLCVHRVFFSWWLDARVAKRGNRRFANEVRESLKFLFDEYGARTVANDTEPPPYFDWAKVSLEVEDIFLVITRDHAIVGAHVSPKHAPQDWLELSAVLTAIGASDGSKRDVEFTRLPTIATVLKPEIARLKQAFSAENFDKTKESALNICKRRNNQAVLRLEKELLDRRRHLGL